jgi:hypothetical protein
LQTDFDSPLQRIWYELGTNEPSGAHWEIHIQEPLVLAHPRTHFAQGLAASAGLAMLRLYALAIWAIIMVVMHFPMFRRILRRVRMIVCHIARFGQSGGRPSGPLWPGVPLARSNTRKMVWKNVGVWAALRALLLAMGAPLAGGGVRRKPTRFRPTPLGKVNWACWDSREPKGQPNCQPINSPTMAPLPITPLVVVAE